MELDAVPDLEGRGVRLRASNDDDVTRRAVLGRSRELVRSFGGDLAADEPMSEEAAAIELRHTFGPGPHWVIADESDTPR